MSKQERTVIKTDRDTIDGIFLRKQNKKKSKKKKEQNRRGNDGLEPMTPRLQSIALTTVMSCQL